MLQESQYDTGKKNKYAFARCYNLFSIDIPGNVTTISEYAFSETSLTSCTLHEGLKEIQAKAFYNKRIAQIILPEGIEAIRSEAFWNTKLTSIRIPQSIRVIEKDAFDVVSATIYAREFTLAPRAFWSGSSFTALKGSTADRFAKDYGMSVTYFACEPATGIPRVEHDWDTGAVVSEGNCAEKGRMSYICTVCREKKEEETNYKEHSYGEWIVTKGQSKRPCGLRRGSIMEFRQPENRDGKQKRENYREIENGQSSYHGHAKERHVQKDHGKGSESRSSLHQDQAG